MTIQQTTYPEIPSRSKLKSIFINIFITSLTGFIVIFLILVILGQRQNNPTGSLLSPMPNNTSAQSNQILIAQNTPQINSASPAPNTATIQPNISTKNTITLPANQTEIKINDSRINQTSPIHLSNINDLPVFIKSQNKGSFVISINNPIDHDLTIDYWLINP